MRLPSPRDRELLTRRHGNFRPADVSGFNDEQASSLKVLTAVKHCLLLVLTVPLQWIFELALRRIYFENLGQDISVGPNPIDDASCKINISSVLSKSASLTG